MSKYRQIHRVKYLRRILDKADACVLASKRINKAGANSLLLQVSWPLTECEHRTLLFIIGSYPLTHAARRALEFVVPRPETSDMPKKKKFKSNTTKPKAKAATETTSFFRSYFPRIRAQSRGRNVRTAGFGRRKKRYHAETNMLNLPFYQNVQVLSFLDVKDVAMCSEVCRAMSGNLVQHAISSIEQNLFMRYRKDLKKRLCGQSNYLQPEEVSQQLELAANSLRSVKGGRKSLCCVRNIWRLSRKLLLNARPGEASAGEGKEQLAELEEECLRKALMTWFAVNHDYLQEKLVCVPGDYIENEQPQMQIHWRQLIVEWLFEFPVAFGVSMEAVALTINLFDRYLCAEQVDRQNLQLCAIGCLLVASSYCDGQPIRESRLVTLAEGSYTLKNIKAMRRQIDALLGKQCVVTCFHYLPQIMHYVSHLKKLEELRKTVTNYLTVFLAAYASLRYSPALVAISAVSVALKQLELTYPCYKTMQVTASFVKDMITLTRFSQAEIHECMICGLMTRNLRRNSRIGQSITTPQ